jgi:hypothetical protein
LIQKSDIDILYLKTVIDIDYLKQNIVQWAQDEPYYVSNFPTPKLKKKSKIIDSGEALRHTILKTVIDIDYPETTYCSRVKKIWTHIWYFKFSHIQNCLKKKIENYWF